MTPDQIDREVRARVEWGHPASKIRTELRRSGADPAVLERVLQEHLRSFDTQTRWKGLLGLFAALGLFCGAYVMGAPFLHPRDLSAEVDERVMPRRSARTEAGRFAAALGFLIGGAVMLTTGAQRLLAGRRSDIQD